MGIKISSLKALLTAQFCGAFNDNFFKTILSLLILSQVPKEQTALLISVTGAVLVLPYIFLSPLAGSISDKISKQKVVIFTRAVEPFLVLAGLIAYYFQMIYSMIFVLFLFGIQSSIFSPGKYGIIPEIVDHKQISKANGYIEALTFLAILAGTTIAGQIQIFQKNIFLLSGIILFAVSATGLISGLMIQKTPAANPNAPLILNPLNGFKKYFIEIKENKNLFLILLATAWFWFLGALFQLSIFIHAKDTLRLSTYETGLQLSALSVGIGAGSFFAGRISDSKVELGLVPIGAIGMALACLLLGLATDFICSLLIFTLLGFTAGIFIVPLNAYFQAFSPDKKRGSYLATANVINNFFILFASLSLWFLNGVLGLSAATIYIFLGLTAFIVAIYAMYIMPELFIRCINWLLVNTIYKCSVNGANNIPETDGALIVSNHVAFSDPVIMLAASERPIRFLMYKPFYKLPLIHFFAKHMKAIPVSESDSRKEIVESLKAAREAIKNGELVCIFAEGALIRTGNMLRFRRGLETIMSGLDAPILPAYIDSIWGSIFSFKGGKFFWKLPKQIPYPVNLKFGKAIPGNSNSSEVRQAVSELGVESFYQRPVYKERLDYRFLKSIRQNPFRTAMVDSSGIKLKAFQVLASVLALSSFLKGKITADKVGILLPPGIPAALANVALTLSGKVLVNLNYTASENSITSAISQCEIKEIITTDKFLNKLKLKLPDKQTIINMESFSANLAQKIKFTLIAFLPNWILRKIYINKKTSHQDLATIIFSSGSSGDPKGVKLSHANITSNIEGLYQVFDLNKKDCLVGVLPFFHSFGFTVTLWLPLIAEIKAAYHYNPIDAGTIGKLTKKHQGTILLATPSFLSTYIKKCTKEQFESLRSVVVGAEKLKEKLSQNFQEKFGLQPMEGYGCTELSPIVAINIPDVRDKRIKQTGNKPGKAGHPLPNVAVKIVSPDDFSNIPAGEDGLILVKGPNVMQGYLNNSELTAKSMHDDWYITGDIGNLDQDGFLQITDRLSRFSKIAGEMVPHVTIEEAIQNALNTSEQVIVVTSLPHPDKGEQLVVLHTVSLDPAEIRKELQSSGLPNLWIPDSKNYFQIEELPVLGSGKVDLKGLREVAGRLV